MKRGYHSPNHSVLDLEKHRPTPDDIRDERYEAEYLEELNQERRQQEEEIENDRTNTL